MIEIIFEITAQDFTDGTYDYRGPVCFTVTSFSWDRFKEEIEFITTDRKRYSERKDAEYKKVKTAWRHIIFEDENEYNKCRIRINAAIDESVEIPYPSSVADKELEPAFIECCFDVKELKKCTKEK